MPQVPLHKLASGNQHTCGLNSTNYPECWGLTAVTSPTVQFSSLGVSNSYFCGIRMNDSMVQCWGDTQGWEAPPSQRFLSIVGGTYFMCGITVNTTIACWKHPQSVNITGYPSNTGYTQISANTFHACAVNYDTSISCWGEDYSGSLQVPAYKYDRVEVGYKYTCATGRFGLYDTCWGQYGGSLDFDGPVVAHKGAATYCTLNKEDNTMTCSDSSMYAVPTSCTCMKFQ